MNILKLLTLFFIISCKSYAGFFDNFMPPTPQKMMDFYNQNIPDMLPHFDREKRIDSQIEDSIMEGDVEYLNADGKKIFSIFIENDDADTGVILLHTRGASPNEEHLIKPLRIDMAEHGYHTLSVQMPVLEKTAKYYDYMPIMSRSHPRIKAAIDFYKNMGVKKIVFVAHGCGVHMLMSYIDKWGDKDISAVVMIGGGATDTGQQLVKQYPLATMHAPVLDVIGSKDYGSVQYNFENRAPHLALGSQNNEQIIIEGNHHYHDGKGEFMKLTNVIYDFLSKI